MSDKQVPIGEVFADMMRTAYAEALVQGSGVDRKTAEAMAAAALEEEGGAQALLQKGGIDPTMLITRFDDAVNVEEFIRVPASPLPEPENRSAGLAQTMDGDTVTVDATPRRENLPHVHAPAHSLSYN